MLSYTTNKSMDKHTTSVGELEPKPITILLGAGAKDPYKRLPGAGSTNQRTRLFL